MIPARPTRVSIQPRTLLAVAGRSIDVRSKGAWQLKRLPAFSHDFGVWTPFPDDSLLSGASAWRHEEQGPSACVSLRDLTGAFESFTKTAPRHAPNAENPR